MPKFKIILEWSGYSRGTEIRIVEAETEEEAREIWYEGKQVDRQIVRDDTESEIDSIVKL